MASQEAHVKVRTADIWFFLADNIKKRKEVLIMEFVNKEMLIGEILDKEPGTAQFFLAMGMHCLGCPSAQMETLKEACDVHGVNVEDILSQMNND